MGKQSDAKERVVATVKHMGLEIDLKHREGSPVLQMESRIPVNGMSKRVRLSARTADLKEAKARAKDFAQALLSKLDGGATGLAAKHLMQGSEVTLGEVFDVYREKKIPLLRPGNARHMEKVMTVFETTTGRDMIVAHFSQTEVDSHLEQRKRGVPHVQRFTGGVPRNVVLRRAGKRALFEDFDRLQSIFRWMKTVRPRGEPLLRVNPLDNLTLPGPVRQARRPVMSVNRYEAMLAVADSAEAELRANRFGRKGAKISDDEPSHRKPNGRRRRRGDPNVGHMPKGFLMCVS